MEKDEYRELLIVNAGEKLYVVEAPAHEAFDGDLIEFKDAFGVSILGELVDKMFCIKNRDEYRCMSHLHTIHQATKIYKAMWSAEADESR